MEHFYFAVLLFRPCLAYYFTDIAEQAELTKKPNRELFKVRMEWFLLINDEGVNILTNKQQEI